MRNLSDTIALIVEWLNIIIGLFILVFSIIGNCLNIYVFTRPTFRNTTAVFYLLACSIASCIQIIYTLIPRILSDGFQVYIVQSNDYYCQSRFMISGVASLCAISYPCWASFDRFICTSRNATIRLNWSSKRFVYRAIVSTILFWSILFIPGCIFSQASVNICILNNQIIINIYSYVITPIGYCILPIIILTYFHISIIKNLRVAPIIIISNTNKRMARQVHRMLVCQLFILVLSGLPFTVETLYSTATASIIKDNNRLAIENLFTNTTRLLFYLNYVSTFYIYVLTSSEFKKIVQNLFY